MLAPQHSTMERPTTLSPYPSAKEQAKLIMAIMDFPARQHARAASFASRRPSFSEFEIAFVDRPVFDPTLSRVLSVIFAPMLSALAPAASDTAPHGGNPSDADSAQVVTGFVYLSFVWEKVCK